MCDMRRAELSSKDKGSKLTSRGARSGRTENMVALLSTRLVLQDRFGCLLVDS